MEQQSQQWVKCFYELFILTVLFFFWFKGKQDPLVNFKIAFRKPIEVFLDGSKHLDMSQGQCNTPEKVAALGKLLAADYKIEGWSGGL